jgi:signal transduction histidine kinase
MNIMQLLKTYFFAILATFWAVGVQAAMLGSETTQVNLLKNVEYLEDPSGLLSQEDVRHMGSQFRAWSGGGDELNFGFTASAYWIRVPLQRMDSAPRAWLLELHYTRINELDFYPPHGEPIHTGSDRPFGTRPYFDQFFVFPLEVSTVPEVFYMRIKSGYALTAPLTIWQPDAYRQQQQRFDLLQFMYYGGLIALAIYGLVIYLSLRDSRFLIYSVYIAVTSMGMFASNGYGRQMFWSQSPAFDEVSQTLFFGLVGHFSVLFARKFFFKLDKRSWLVSSMQLSQCVFLLICLLALLHMVWPVWLATSTQMLMVNAVAMGLLISATSICAYRRKQQGIRFFVLGWGVLWVGACISTFRAFGWLPSNGFTSYALQMSTMMETVLMAMALGELLKLEHEAHIASQKEALLSKQALLEMTQASEDRLMQAIRERTEQLETSLMQEKNLREQYVRFGSIISHEFRTPLSIIQGQVSLMRKEHEHGIDRLFNRMAVIYSATQRLAVMFEKWLRSDAMTQTLEEIDRQPLKLSSWLGTLVSTRQHLFFNHEVALQMNPQADNVLADEYHLDVALSNLIDNAAKYSPDHTTITIETRLKPGFVGIAVTDQGPGIAQEDQDKVFGEFFRLAPESRIRGVGLGLSIVDRIVRAHGGHVELTSTPGSGATFCIWLLLT